MWVGDGVGWQVLDFVVMCVLLSLLWQTSMASAMAMAANAKMVEAPVDAAGTMPHTQTTYDPCSPRYPLVS